MLGHHQFKRSTIIKSISIFATTALLSLKGRESLSDKQLSDDAVVDSDIAITPDFWATAIDVNTASFRVNAPHSDACPPAITFIEIKRDIVRSWVAPRTSPGGECIALVGTPTSAMGIY